MKTGSLADLKKWVIAAFADNAIKGGFVSLTELREYLGDPVAILLQLLIYELRSEGLVEPAYDEEHGEGIKLTAKGAVKLWHGSMPEEQSIVLRQD